eukprot:13784383-Alexandrium_andersonii.AAC.1
MRGACLSEAGLQHESKVNGPRPASKHAWRALARGPPTARKHGEQPSSVQERMASTCARPA